MRAASNLTLAVASLGLLFGALEAATRIAVPDPRGANTTVVPRSIIAETGLPDLPYVLRPNGSGIQRFGSDPRSELEPGARLTYRINSLGLRGPETTRSKPAGVFRVLALGDSFTFGAGVRAEHAWPAVLETDQTPNRHHSGDVPAYPPRRRAPRSDRGQRCP